MAVMRAGMSALTDKLFGRQTKHGRSSSINESANPLSIQPKDAFAGRFQEQTKMIGKSGAIGQQASPFLLAALELGDICQNVHTAGDAALVIQHRIGADVEPALAAGQLQTFAL